MKESTIVHLVMQNKTSAILPFLRDISDELANSLITKCENKMKKKCAQPPACINVKCVHDYTEMIDLLKNRTFSRDEKVGFFMPSFYLPKSNDCGPAMMNCSPSYGLFPSSYGPQ